MINQARLVKTFTDLVKIDSESKNEIDVAIYIKNKLKKLGISYKIDSSKKLTKSNHGNIIATLGKNKKYPTILLSSHMDTVTNGKSIKPVVKKNYITSDGRTILGAVHNLRHPFWGLLRPPSVTLILLLHPSPEA